MSEKILDSGNRREFSTGAVRDMAEGKGRFDLMPLDIISDLCFRADLNILYNILSNISGYMTVGKTIHILNALVEYINYRYDDFCSAMLELSKHFEEGCKKYGEDNWQKGIPMSAYIDSAVRHLIKDIRGDTDEPHDRAFIWNLVCLLWTHKHKPEMNDLPFKDLDTAADYY